MSDDRTVPVVPVLLILEDQIKGCISLDALLELAHEIDTLGRWWGRFRCDRNLTGFPAIDETCKVDWA